MMGLIEHYGGGYMKLVNKKESKRFLPLKLQFFAETAGEPSEPTSVAEPGAQEPSEPGEEPKQPTFDDF